eukprot:TRINITY_DN5255_c0_g1_i2.p1 TRINITY_DN5255_c0_g1~~TRINITY_DN5255_c0_g1_i2.p1  ORF type:complete len:495 (+),score=68.93 TRINITY_DN5255_c0_g1_i2:100-1584(+)
MSLDCSVCKLNLPRSSFTNAQIKTLKVARKCKECEKKATTQSTPSNPNNSNKQQFVKVKYNQFKIKEFGNCGLFQGDVLDFVCRFLVRYPRTLLSMSQVCTLWRRSALDEDLWKAVLDRRSWHLGIPMAISYLEKYKTKFIEEALWLRARPKGESIAELFVSHLVSVDRSSFIYGFNATGTVQINPEAPLNNRNLPIHLSCKDLLYSDPYFVFLLEPSSAKPHQTIYYWNRKEPKHGILPDLTNEIDSKAYLSSIYFTLLTESEDHVQLDVWDFEKKTVVLSDQYQKIHSIANDKMWYWICYTQDDLTFLKGIEIGSSMSEHSIPLPHPIQLQCSSDRLYCFDEGHLIIKHITLDKLGNLELIEVQSIVVANFQNPQMQLQLEHNIVLLWENNNMFNVVDLERKKTILQAPLSTMNRILHCDRLKLVYLTTEDEKEIVKIWNIKLGKLITTYKTAGKHAAAFKDNYLLLLKLVKMERWYTPMPLYQVWRFYCEA